MKLTNLACTVPFVLLAAACGGGPGTGPLTEATAEEYCTDGCEYDIMCGDETDPLDVCVADCVADLAGWAREDAVAEVLDCVTALECTANDDHCFAEVDPLSIHREWEDQCYAILGGEDCLGVEAAGLCEVDPDPQNDDVGFVRLLAPVVVEEMLACLEDNADCQTRLSCLQGVFEAYGIDG